MVCEIIAMPTPRCRFSRVSASTRSTMPRPAAQRPPQLVEDDEVVPPRLQAGVRERVRDRRPRRTRSDQHASSAAACRSVSESSMLDTSNTTGRSRRIGWSVCVGEHLADAGRGRAAPISDAYERFGGVAVAVQVAAVQRDVARSRSGASRATWMQVREDRRRPRGARRAPRGARRGASPRGRSGGCRAHDRDQRGRPSSAGGRARPPDHLRARLPGQPVGAPTSASPGSRTFRWPRPRPSSITCAAERLDQVHVVGLEVAQHQRQDAVARPGRAPSAG